MGLVFNSAKGVLDIINATKNNWNYLCLGDNDTEYNGSNISNAVGTQQIDTGYPITDATSFTRSFQLTPYYWSGKTINKIFDATTSTGTVVDSYDQINSIESTVDRKFRITIKTEILR